MENFWLFQNEEEEEEEESESDEDKKRTELEERLYAVVHHNDLSQPLPSELAKHYSIQCADDGELEVTLNNSLEVLQSAERENMSNHLTESLDVNKTNVTMSSNVDEGNDDDSIIIISGDESNIKSSSKQDSKFVGNDNVRKRFKRYSDYNVDELESKECRVESSAEDIYYFNHSPELCKKKRYKDIKVPPPQSCDWQKDANSSYISVGSFDEQGKQEILCNMTNALVELNPEVNRNDLFRFARILYLKNVRLFKNRLKRRLKKAKRQANKDIQPDSSVNSSMSLIDKSSKIKDLRKKIEEYRRASENDTPKRKKEEHFNGSITLNVSPFRPDKSLPPDAHVDSSPIMELNSTHFPTKWTKEMIKYYTRRSKKYLDKDINEVIADLKKKTSKKDWSLDPNDRDGHYHRPYVASFQRCENCNERGHGIQECYKPIKLPACFLCGELYHSSYSCPNQICWKCGAFLVITSNGNTCNDCYFASFGSEEPCGTCGEVTHKTVNCTDLWRSFHATTGGEKKIPDNIEENKRKSCCNCARGGHFSHSCPFISYSGQQVSSFVKNYSAKPSDLGDVDVTISKNYAEILSSLEADQFLHYLSNHTNAVITFSDHGSDLVLSVNGTFDQCKTVKSEIEAFVNSRKRKRKEPGSKRKRKRVRF